MRAQHTLLPIDEETALVYAAAVRELRGGGNLIGTNDLWIGASSLRYGLPLVTSNAEHFGRLGGLEVITYR